MAALHVDGDRERTEKSPILTKGSPARFAAGQLLAEIGDGMQLKPPGNPGRLPAPAGKGPDLPRRVVKGRVDPGGSAPHDGHFPWFARRRSGGSGRGVGRVHGTPPLLLDGYAGGRPLVPGLDPAGGPSLPAKAQNPPAPTGKAPAGFPHPAENTDGVCPKRAGTIVPIIFDKMRVRFPT